jgi:hypothetical protein
LESILGSLFVVISQVAEDSLEKKILRIGFNHWSVQILLAHFVVVLIFIIKRIINYLNGYSQPVGVALIEIHGSDYQI